MNVSPSGETKQAWAIISSKVGISDKRPALAREEARRPAVEHLPHPPAALQPVLQHCGTGVRFARCRRSSKVKSSFQRQFGHSCAEPVFL